VQVHLLIYTPTAPDAPPFALLFGKQDFVQVLAMFAGFDFDWPPAVRAIFNAFSLVNFNFELLAPECSVSVNFETKW
jgi:hypothetical protein